MIGTTRTSLCHPQRNSQVGRHNRVIADTIIKYCAKNCTNGTFTCPASISFTTPPYVRLSARLRSRCFRVSNSFVLYDPRLELGDVGAELSEKLYEVHSHAQISNGEEQRRQKEYYQRKVHGETFTTGDFVWQLEPHKPKSQKFHFPWHGPCEVLRQTSKVNYWICKPVSPENGKTLISTVLSHI